MAEEQVGKPKPDEQDKGELKVDRETVKDLEIRKDESEQVKGGGRATCTCL